MKAKLGIAAALITAALGTGCAIHSQAPIKEVAYDFSDSHFYDRAYAPSPQYEADSATAALSGPAPVEGAAEAAEDEPAY